MSADLGDAYFDVRVSEDAVDGPGITIVVGVRDGPGLALTLTPEAFVEAWRSLYVRGIQCLAAVRVAERVSETAMFEAVSKARGEREEG